MDSIRITLYVGVLIMLASLPGCSRSDSVAHGKPLTVLAAASTTDVMRQAGARFEKATGYKVAFSFGSSASLARQIKAGSPADVFVSADEQWMDDLAAAGDIHKDTRTDLFANDLVLIARAAAPRFDVEMNRDFDFAAALPQVRRIAVGDPEHVPAGRYARQSLESLGWWNALHPLLIPAPDVRAALRLVEMGEADVGIVYATDAMASDKVTVIARFPDDSHDPIRYPIAQCSDSEGAATFIQFFRCAEMIAVCRQAGFRMLPQAAGGGG